MKKILFVVNHLGGGGIEQVLSDYISLLKDQYSISVLSIYEIHSLYENNIASQTNYSCLDWGRNRYSNRVLRSLYSRLFDLFSIQKFFLKKYLHQHKFDTVIAFSDGLSIQLVSKLNLENKIAWIHTDFLEDKRLLNIDYKYFSTLYDQFNNCVFVSQSLRDKYVCKLKLSKTIHIPNPLIRTRFKEEKIKFRPTDKGIYRLLAIGRLSQEKGFDRLIESMSKISLESLNRLHLTIVGDGPEKHNLKLLAKQRKIENYISFTGFQSNPFKGINNHTILLVPSRFEGFGLVLLEALYYHIPIVSTQTVGTSEILQNGKFGFLIKNTDDAFDSILGQISEIAFLLQDYSLLSDSALSRYDMYSIKKQIENIL